MKKILSLLLLAAFVVSADDVIEHMQCVLVRKGCDRLVPMPENTNILTKCRGEMKCDTSFVLTSNPPQYQHKCTACGAFRNFFESYPKIEFRPMPSGTNASASTATNLFIATNGTIIIK